jgi:hypothetical protein
MKVKESGLIAKRREERQWKCVFLFGVRVLFEISRPSLFIAGVNLFLAYFP